jgi:hypothetical protein
MPSPEQFLTALWTLEAQLPQFLEPAALQRLKRQLEPLKQTLVREEANGAEVAALMEAYPSLQGPWRAALMAAEAGGASAGMWADLEGLLAGTDSSGSVPPPGDVGTDSDFEDLDALLMPQFLGGESKGFEGLAGAPVMAPTARRYVCPVEGCDQEWFRVGQRQPPLCPVHGKALIPDPAVGDGG